MKRWQAYALLAAVVLAFGSFAYYYGFAITAILVVVTLNYVMCLRSFKALKKLIIESQAVLGENDKKLLRRIQSIEDKIDG